uniref:tRNA:m(4)X modification enzyme TRM13 n=1 Tax=Plectus sambesii TaxID=2011161 RepID=A0A914X3W6_9BILA
METENTLSSSELLPSIRADGDQMRCSYMLPHKKRYCRMLVKAGRRFCGEHIVFDPQDQTRIVCPLDPKHTVYRTDLKDHLATKCNGRLPSDLWIQENVNVVPSEERLGESQNEKGPEDGRLNCSEEDTARVAKIIEEAYSKLAAEAISDACLKTEAIENFMEANENQNETHKKHLVQQSSIIGNLAARHLLNNQDDSCFIELGAGKAQLTYWLAKTIPNCRFLLIDRSGARNKYDNKAMQVS